jgi:putative heme-binding domain-containing protein
LGPDLEAVVTKGRETLLTQILHPNRTLSSRAELRWVETRDQGLLLGPVLEEHPAGLWILTSDGQTLPLPRAVVRSLSPLQRSSMPEGLQIGLTFSQMADLLEFLTRPGN